MEQLDSEMLKNLDFLLDFEVAEEESNWEILENLEVEEKKDGIQSDTQDSTSGAGADAKKSGELK